MAIPTKTRLQLRTLARRLSDMENTSFVSDDELNTYLNLGAQELYDLFAEVHGQEFFLKTQSIQLESGINVYDLADDFHVLKGVDWLKTVPPSAGYDEENVSGGLLPVWERRPFGSVTPGVLDPSSRRIYLWVPDQIFSEDTVPLKPYTFFERHDGVNSEVHGYPGMSVDERMRFRVFTERKSTYSVSTSSGEGGVVTTETLDTDEFVHRIRFNPLGSGYVLVWYIPSPPSLDADTDVLVGFHGYEEYVSLYAAIRALRKEESDISWLTADLEAMKTRIRNMGSYRDMGHPSRAQDMASFR